MFQNVFEKTDDQFAVYDNLRETLDLDKMLNTTIFAYGQTNSGKTYTMFGTNWAKHYKNLKRDNEHVSTSIEEDRNIYGLIPRLVVDLFENQIN